MLTATTHPSFTLPRGHRLARMTTVLALGLTLGAVACGETEPGDGAEPEYHGRASDENFHSIQEALNTGPASTDPEHTATLDAPGDTATGDSPPTFEWTNPDENAPDVAGGCLNQPALAVYTGLRAEHCPVLTGYVYWLQLDVPDFEGIVTTNTSWTPDADQWAAITAQGGEVTGELITAYFAGAELDSGPWTSPVSFTVE